MHAAARRGTAAMVAAAALWGATFVALRDVAGHVDAAALVFARFALAAIPLTVWAACRPGALSRAAAMGGVLAGGLYAAGFWFQAMGIRHTTAGTSAFLTSTGSLVAGLLAWPILGQRPTVVLMVAIAAAVAGTVLLSEPALGRLGPGHAWTLAGALAFGLQVVVVARVAPAVDPIGFAALQSVALAVWIAPAALGRLTPVLLAPEVLPGFAYLVVAGSIAAPVLQILAQRTLSAGRAGLLLGLEPVFAVAIALTWGAERFPARWWLGAALIVVAVAGVEWHADARSRMPSSRTPP